MSSSAKPAAAQRGDRLGGDGVVREREDDVADRIQDAERSCGCLPWSSACGHLDDSWTRLPRQRYRTGGKPSLIVPCGAAARRAARRRSRAGRRRRRRRRSTPMMTVDPRADPVGEQVLQADDRERAEHRPGEGAHAAEQRHQDDLAGERPVRVGERREAEHQRLERARQAGERGREHEGEQLVAVDVVAERDRRAARSRGSP